MGENNNQQDPRLIQPEIIGELRKDKIGKPILVIELFLLFGIVLAALPLINNQLNDEQSQLYKLIHGAPVDIAPTIPVDTKKEEFLDGSKVNLLAFDTKMKYENIVIQNFELSNGIISCVMYAYNGIIDLDKKDLYLEITSTSDQVLGAIKLVGTFDNVEQHVKLEAYGIQFNPNLSYSGKIVEMTDDDFPQIELNEDTNGFATLTCTKDNRSIQYYFQNKFLIKIDDTVYHAISDYTDDEYLNLLKEYQEKASKLGATVASVNEVMNGFQYRAIIDYDTKYVIPDSVVDYNYYPENALAKKIAYAQKSKGFDCK
jgi:hypothetical protein